MRSSVSGSVRPSGSGLPGYSLLSPRQTTLLVALALLLTVTLAAQSSDPDADSPPKVPESEAPVVESDSDVSEDATSSQRTALNLLGEVDAESGEGRRNENVRLTLIDNNVLKELQTRMGTTATLTESFDPARGYFGKEYGGSPSAPLHLPGSSGGGTHAEVFWSHNNSALSARSFFQVGKVQPARTNDYGFKVTTSFGSKTSFTVDASQRKLRGQVNGNVLVPGAEERVPTATDPATLDLVQRILGAYPSQVPNRTDINRRALNTNARQNIDNDRATLSLQHRFNDADTLNLRYSATLQQVEAFQLVGGQNPDTTTKNHQPRITWTRVWNPATTSDFSIGYDRTGSLLVPEETSIGPFYLFGRLMQSIGPGGNFPLDRAQNLFRYAGRVKSLVGNHSISAGFSVLRRQINGLESNDHRGTFSFRNDFGRNIAENLLLGTASAFTGAIGDTHRGFRGWDFLFYAGDDWRVTPNLNLNFGLRYEPVAKPNEVDGLTEVPYDCACLNFAPTFGFAYKAHERWGVFRGAYGIHYGGIFNATYMQTRFNAPGVFVISVANPDLVDPFKDLTPADLQPGARSQFFRLDPELTTPYSHQYNFNWQLRPVGDWTLDLGYVGSRSHKLLQMWYLNRAHPVEGIPLTSGTINLRRADDRFFDIRHTLNGSRGYYDAAKIALRIPSYAGLTLEASYWFSKAIDLGSNYTNTSAGRDGRTGRSPYEFDVHGLMRGPSDFDQSHAYLWTANYSTPALKQLPRWSRALLGNWQLSSIVLLKSGTPFTVRTTDGPGNGNVDGAGSDRPNLVDPSVLGRTIDDPDTSRAMLPREAFATLTPGEPHGNLGASTFRKDGPFNVNAAVSRRFSLRGDASLLFRAESLNFTNHPQFAEPGIDISGQDFGQITNTLNDGRAFKFTLRLSL